MTEFLKLTSDVETNSVFGRIRLGSNYETFELNTREWSSEKYLQQWKHAAAWSMNKRETSGIIKNYESSLSQVKKVGIYNLIPKELAYPSRDLFEDESEKDFYITENFIFVTEDVSVLDSNFHFDQIYNAFGNYFPIYYLNFQKIEKFYLYLSQKIEGVSHWEVRRDDLCSFIDS